MASPSILDTFTSSIVHGNLTSLLPLGTNISVALLERIFPTKPGRTSWQDRVYDILDFFSQRTAFENTSLGLALATFLFLIMSWTSRFGNLGRFSPFTRSPPQGNTVSDADFSYITTEDLKRHQQQNNAHAPPTPEELGPARDTDALVLRNKGQSYVVHFPAYSIAKSELSIGQVRDAAGKKMGASPGRIKLLFKGKNLKDDSRTCRQEGLRDHEQILCTVGDIGSASGSEDDDDDDEVDGIDSAADPDSAKRRRNRNKNKKRRAKAKVSGSTTPSDSANLGAPPAQTSRAPSPKPPQPQTPLEKIAALRAVLQDYDSQVRTFVRTPPAEPAKREFEHKRLGEMILTQVMLKTDAIETEGDPDARSKRKELVRETQVVLKELDDAAARYGA